MKKSKSDNMEAKRNGHYLITACFAFLTMAGSSCTQQYQPKQETTAVPVKEDIPSFESIADTTLQLKFTKGVRSILEDSKGNIWFGSHQEGVGLFDGKTLKYFTVADGLSDNQVRSIFEDADGVVWFECGKGISRYDGQKITIQSERNYFFKDAWQSGKNDIWFKGDEIHSYNELEKSPGVYRYDGKTFTYHVFPISPTKDGAFSYSVSTPFIKGKNGRVWFGTYGAVIGYDGRFTAIGTDPAGFIIMNDNSLGLDDETGYLHVRSIMEDSKGRLWIGNNGIGVLCYDGDTTINFSQAQGLISENSLLNGGYRSPPGSLEHVFSIGEDSHGNIWFGDRDTGAWKYDGNSMRNYTEADGLTTTQIWQIYRTRKGKMWFAMADGAVCAFNGTAFDRIF